MTFTNAQALLHHLRGRGVTIHREGDELVLNGPFTTDEIETARRLKPEIMQMLSEETVAPEALAAGWRGAVLELGAVAGWPAIAYRKPSSTAPGEHAWRLFAQRHSVEDLMALTAATRAYLARLPMPPADVVPPVVSAPTLDDGTPANRCADCQQPCGMGARCSPCAARRALHPSEGT